MAIKADANQDSPPGQFTLIHIYVIVYSLHDSGIIHGGQGESGWSIKIMNNCFVWYETMSVEATNLGETDCRRTIY